MVAAGASQLATQVLVAAAVAQWRTKCCVCAGRQGSDSMRAALDQRTRAIPGVREGVEQGEAFIGGAAGHHVQSLGGVPRLVSMGVRRKCYCFTTTCLAPNGAPASVGHGAWEAAGRGECGSGSSSSSSAGAGRGQGSKAACATKRAVGSAAALELPAVREGQRRLQRINSGRCAARVKRGTRGKAWCLWQRLRWGAGRKVRSGCVCEAVKERRLEGGRQSSREPGA